MLPGFSYFRRRPKHATEAAQLLRLHAPHMRHDHELEEIRADIEAGHARELADNEIQRRAGLSAHERMREAARRSG